MGLTSKPKYPKRKDLNYAAVAKLLAKGLGLKEEGVKRSKGKGTLVSVYLLDWEGDRFALPGLSVNYVED